MRIMTTLALALLPATLFTGCTRDVQATDAQRIEQQYGVSGAFADTVATPDGAIKGTMVPITLDSGRQGHLFIPQNQTNEPYAVYIRDERGLHPVQLRDNVSRDEVARAPRIVETRAAPVRAKTRSWEREVLIIGGSAGGGAAIGALAAGKKGAVIGAAAGGVGGLIYDLATRKKK